MQKGKKKTIVILWSLFGLGWFFTIVLFLLIEIGAVGYMPPIENLQNPIDKYASQLISSNGEIIGSYARTGSNRIFTTYENLSPHLVDALIATEDSRFYSHSGVDAKAILRAIIKTGILRQRGSGGGSTITQQLAKQLYSPRAENIFVRALQKPIEWVIALKLERNYTKEEIISLYFNQFDFLYNAIGIESASKTYFNKSASELTIEESATLVGMCKNPAFYNPILHEENSKKRRDVVLDLMRKAGMLSRQEADSLKLIPLKVEFRQIGHNEGLAPYFREHLRMLLTAKKPKRSDYNEWTKEQYSLDSLAWETNPIYGWCNKNRKSDGSTYDLYADGLKIYTTLNSTMQRYAEEAVSEHIGGYIQSIFDNEKKNSPTGPFSPKTSAKDREDIIKRAIKQSDRFYQMRQNGASLDEIDKAFNTPQRMKVWSWRGSRDTIMTPLDSIRYYKKFLRASFMAMNPYNGHILAYVGGVDFRTFKFDMVYQGRRQVGSTIKPFLYSLSMIEGISPCDEIIHEPITLYDANGRPWTPRSGGASRQGEPVSITWGLQNSSNWVTAYLMSKTSPLTFVRMLRSFGIKGNIDPVISLAAGTPDVSLYEMVSAYTAFVTQGIRSEPLPISRIEDQYGNVIASFTPQMSEVLPADAALKMLHMMRAVVDGGTGGRLRFRYGLKMPLGGKTGTTQNNSDGWFIGFSPQIVAGCWVGGEDRSIHFNSTAFGQGASVSLPVFGLFMDKVYKDRRLGYSINDAFEVPKGWSPCGAYSNDTTATEIVYEEVPSLDEATPVED